jgi:hypothetical protein
MSILELTNALKKNNDAQSSSRNTVEIKSPLVLWEEQQIKMFENMSRHKRDILEEKIRKG